MNTFDRNNPYNKFNDFCSKAYNDAEFFKTFRSDNYYKIFLEYIRIADTKKYIDIISENSKELFKSMELFRENDLVGGPTLHNFDDIGTLSQSTLRYIKILSELKVLFGSLDGMKIVEIGGGFGGQCNIISKIFNYAEYTLVDLPEVLNLQRKCIELFKTSNVIFKTMDDLEDKEYDLVISNYAFSECPTKVKEFYLDKIIVKSKRGYLTMDMESRTHYKEYMLQRLKDKNVEENPENPEKKVINDLTMPNYVLTWKE